MLIFLIVVSILILAAALSSAVIDGLLQGIAIFLVGGLLWLLLGWGVLGSIWTVSERIERSTLPAIKPDNTSVIFKLDNNTAVVLTEAKIVNNVENGDALPVKRKVRQNCYGEPPFKEQWSFDEETFNSSLHNNSLPPVEKAVK